MKEKKEDFKFLDGLGSKEIKGILVVTWGCLMVIWFVILGLDTEDKYYEGTIIYVEGKGSLRIESEESYKGIRDIQEGKYELDGGSHKVYIKGIDFEEGLDLPKLAFELDESTNRVIKLNGITLDNELYTTGLYTLSSRDGSRYELGVSPEGLLGGLLLEASNEYGPSKLELHLETISYGNEYAEDSMKWSITYEPYEK